MRRLRRVLHPPLKVFHSLVEGEVLIVAVLNQYREPARATCVNFRSVCTLDPVLLLRLNHTGLAGGGAPGHDYVLCDPVDFWVVLAQPRVPQDHILLAQLCDRKVG
jgi:hypothetical protein